MVLLPLEPSATLRLEGDAESVKFGAPVMVSAMVVFAESAPEVPLTVTV